MLSALTELLQRLQQAHTFEDAAADLVSALLGHAAVVPGLLRGMVHLRPAEGYQGLLALSPDGVPIEADLAPSSLSLIHI